jgi:hypothetical protein
MTKSRRLLSILGLFGIIAIIICFGVVDQGQLHLSMLPAPQASPQMSAVPLFGVAAKPTELPSSAPPSQRETIQHIDDVLGVMLNYPATAKLVTDQYLGPDYGLTIVGPDEHLMLRVGWLHAASASQLNATLQDIINSYPTITIKQGTTQIDGRMAATLAPVPGMDDNTYILVAANERLYQLIYGKGAIDSEGRALLDSLKFFTPTKELSALKLTPQADSLTAATPTPTPAPTQVDVEAILRQRPFEIKPLVPGALCPMTTTPGTQVAPDFSAALGNGPVYAVGFASDSKLHLHFAAVVNGWRTVKVLWISHPSYPGPILIRGQQLDGVNPLHFGRGIGVLQPDLFLPDENTAPTRSHTPSGWHFWTSYTYVYALGCYAYQIDGLDFSYRIIVEAVDA